MAHLHFLLRSRPDLKLMGPIMVRAEKDGNFQTWEQVPTRGRTPVSAKDVPSAVQQRSPRAVAPDVLFCVYAPDVPSDWFRWQDTGLGRRIVIVPNWGDFLMHPPYKGAVTCYQTEEWRARHGDGPVTGTPLREHVGPISDWVPRDPVHVCFTMKRGIEERWRRSIPGRVWYIRQLIADRQMVRHAGLRFILKTRHKHRDPWWLRALGPVVDDSGPMYPDVSQWLLRDAMSMTHFHSGAVAEAVIQNVPRITYRRPLVHHLGWLKAVAQPPDDFYHPDWMEREEYLRRFVGPEEASARILEVALG